MAEAIRAAGTGDAAIAARLLHDFNAEFDTPSPGVEVLSHRLERLLAERATQVLLVGEPAQGILLATLRPNVWYDGGVLQLDELYVRPHLRGRGLGTLLVERMLADATAAGVGAIEIDVDEGDVDAQRFYRRHGFSDVGDVTGERALYFVRDL